MDTRTETLPAPAPHLAEGESVSNAEVKDGVIVFTIVSEVQSEVEMTNRPSPMRETLQRLHAKYPPLSDEELAEMAEGDPRLERLLIHDEE